MKSAREKIDDIFGIDIIHLVAIFADNHTQITLCNTTTYTGQAVIAVEDATCPYCLAASEQITKKRHEDWLHKKKLYDAHKFRRRMKRLRGT